ncbi:MAG: choice-of-anchor U domain-containing protein, partial [Thermodesulfobacteriota bacterium]|nr:choice-of-anchor U domain-containing protein [Thermodesulfobacteriota bacterium]
DTCTLSVATEGNGSVTPSGGSYEKGTVVELLATGSAGWDFSYWTDGVEQSGKNPLPLTMNKDRSVTAVFVEAPGDTCTLSVATEGNGSVTPSGGSYEKGTVVELLATGSAGWDFSYWTDGVEQSGKNPLPLTMNKDRSVTAVFVEHSDVQDTRLGSPESKESLPSTPSDTRDGNNDGIIDAMQDHVVSLKTSDGQHDVTIESVAGTLLRDCTAVGKSSEAHGLPSEGEYPYGFFSFVVQNVDIGGATTVTIYLPEDASPTIYYKYGPEPENPEPHWYEFMYDGKTRTGAVIAGSKITLYFVDGQRGDDDLQANGTIVDQGGPGSEEKKKAGCFVSAMAFGFLSGGY